MGTGESKLPWAGEELGLTPTGAWLEEVVGSGTPPPTLYSDPKGSELGREPPSGQCPFLTHSSPAPGAPRSQAPSNQLHCGLTAGPFQ